MSYLEHHGILGQKWGVRRFQRKDGIRTAAGKAMYNENKKSGFTDQQKKYLKIGAGIVASCVVAYAGYKITTSPHTRAAMNKVLHGSKEKRMSEISKAIDDMGPEIVRKSDKLGSQKKSDNASQVKKNTADKETQKYVDSINAAVKMGRAVNLDSQDMSKLIRRTVGMGDNKVGTEKFNQAVKANDDLVQDLLKKNAQMLKGF